MYHFFFLDSLLYNESDGRILEFFSFELTGWEMAQPVHQVFHG